MFKYALGIQLTKSRWWQKLKDKQPSPLNKTTKQSWENKGKTNTDDLKKKKLTFKSLLEMCIVTGYFMILRNYFHCDNSIEFKTLSLLEIQTKIFT